MIFNDSFFGYHYPHLRLYPPLLGNAWFGGLIGAFAVFGALNYAPKMGAAAYVSVTILGIVSASLVLDHFGAIGFQKNPITASKLFGAGLVICGMTIIQFPTMSTIRSWQMTLLLVVATFLRNY